MLSLKQLLRQGQSAQIGLYDRPTNFTYEVFKWVQFNKRNLDFTLSTAEKIKKKAAQEIGLPESFIPIFWIQKNDELKVQNFIQKVELLQTKKEDNENEVLKRAFCAQNGSNAAQRL
ncbi:hypothetical protein ABPG72_012143 [Tetrahymena utriculariae]